MTSQEFLSRAFLCFIAIALLSVGGCREQKIPTDQKVNVGGLELAYGCQGEGRPTVMIETGGGDPGSTWRGVLPSIAEFTRVCLYSRAGLGASDPPRPGPRTVETVVEELHCLLTQAEIEGPYVLVGHSIGGVHIRRYTARYPEEVVGMVLIDTTHETYVALQASLTSPVVEHFQDARRKARPPKPVEGIADLGEYLAAVGDLPRLGDLPLIVLGSTRKPDLERWRSRMPEDLRALYERHRKELDDYRLGVNALGEQLVREQSQLSSRGRYIGVEDAGHFIHLDRPDLVIGAIRDVVESVR